MWFAEASSSQYFFVFVFLLFFALVNMFLAIINDAYAKEQLDLHERKKKKKKMVFETEASLFGL